jgi:hypothetical protein
MTSDEIQPLEKKFMGYISTPVLDIDGIGQLCVNRVYIPTDKLGIGKWYVTDVATPDAHFAFIRNPDHSIMEVIVSGDTSDEYLMKLAVCL